MKKTKGYVTDDGTFFENENEARLYEAEVRLRYKLAVEWPAIAQEPFLAIVLSVLTELRSYINARDAASPPDSDTPEIEDRVESQPDTPKVGDGLGHVSAAEEDLKALLKLPIRRPRDVSDLGSGAHAETVSDSGEVDGAGSGGVDASSVRSGKDMAVESSPKVARTRRRNGQKDIQG